MGKIVYDGTLRGAPPSGEPGFAAKLKAVAEAAEAEGSVLTSLPRPPSRRSSASACASTASPAGPSSTTPSAPRSATATSGRYGVRLAADGTSVALKPDNLEAAKDQSADGSRGAAAAAGAADGGALSALEERVRGALTPLRAVEGDAGFWTFRRMGYTEADNPGHQLVIISARMPVAASAGGNPMLGCKALQPTAAEILQGLEGAARLAGGKPTNIAVDEKSIVARLQHVLGPTASTAATTRPCRRSSRAWAGRRRRTPRTRSKVSAPSSPRGAESAKWHVRPCTR